MIWPILNTAPYGPMPVLEPSLHAKPQLLESDDGRGCGYSILFIFTAD